MKKIIISSVVVICVGVILLAIGVKYAFSPLIGVYDVKNSYSITFDPFTNSIWTINHNISNGYITKNSYITKINASDGIVIGTYPVGEKLIDITFDSYTNSIWVADQTSGNIFKINPSNGDIVTEHYLDKATISSITFDSQTKSIWVAYWIEEDDGYVAKIDASSGSITDTYKLKARSIPIDITFDSSTNSIWIINWEQNSEVRKSFLTKINAFTGDVIGTYPYLAGRMASKITFAPSTKSIWVDTTKIKASTGEIIETFDIKPSKDANFAGVAVDPSSNFIFMTFRTHNRYIFFLQEKSWLIKINPSNAEIIRTNSAGKDSSNIAIDTSTNSVWTAGYNSGKVMKFKN